MDRMVRGPAQQGVGPVERVDSLLRFEQTDPLMVAALGEGARDLAPPAGDGWLLRGGSGAES